VWRDPIFVTSFYLKKIVLFVSRYGSQGDNFFFDALTTQAWLLREDRPDDGQWMKGRRTKRYNNLHRQLDSLLLKDTGLSPPIEFSYKQPPYLLRSPVPAAAAIYIYI
jgi:hypothetical protein